MLTGHFICESDTCNLVHLTCSWHSVSRGEEGPPLLKCVLCGELMTFAGYELGELLDDAEQ